VLHSIKVAIPLDSPPPPFWKVEEDRGRSRKAPRWVWLASSLRRHDAEQLMFKLQVGAGGMKAQRVVSSDGRSATYVPFGPYDKGEFS
jgi:hypothetical protein